MQLGLERGAKCGQSQHVSWTQKNFYNIIHTNGDVIYGRVTVSVFYTVIELCMHLIGHRQLLNIKMYVSVLPADVCRCRDARDCWSQCSLCYTN